MCHTCPFSMTVMKLTYDSYMFHGRIVDDFSMITVDSTTVDNHKSTLVTGTNDLGNDMWAHTSLYSGQVEELVDCLAIPLILVTLLPTLVVLIVTIILC